MRAALKPSVMGCLLLHVIRMRLRVALPRKKMLDKLE
jgi:hypothetical protein